MFTHHAKRNGAIMVVSYQGSITERSKIPMPGFDKAMDGLCSAVILDLSGVEYINSVGVSSFMDTFKYIRSQGIKIALCSPTPHILKVLKLARTELMVPVAESRSAASNLIFTFTQNRTTPRRESILLVKGQVNIHDGFRDVLKETQQEANYNIVTSLNPSRAWKILCGKNIQLVILDVTISKSEGHNFLRKVRTNRDLKGIPFIIASDEEHFPEAAYYTKNGADDILRFPFNPYETPIRVRTALSLYYSWQKNVALGTQSTDQQHRQAKWR